MSLSASGGKAARLMELIEKVYEPEIISLSPDIQGRELKEPCVIICNHTRRTLRNCLISFDGAIVRYAFKNEKVCSLMASDLMEKPITGELIKGLDCIPVCRDAASTDWIRACREKLSEGCSVIIFPEGTTLKEGDFADFKPGFALLAGMAGVRVLPVAINGEYSLFHPGRLKLTIGTPQSLNMKSMSPAALNREADRFRKIVEDMYDDMVSGSRSESGDEEFANI